MSKRLTYDEIIGMLNAFSPGLDPSDPKAKTRARILRAASTHFEQRGYRRASIDDIARDSGIAKGTVYVHFKSKAELLFHVIVEEKKRLVERFHDLFTAEFPPDERLRRYIEIMLLALDESPLSRKMLTGDVELLHFMSELPEELQKKMATQQDAGWEMLLGGIGQIDALTPEERDHRFKAFAALMGSMGHLLVVRARVGLPLREYARQLAKIIVDGVGAR